MPEDAPARTALLVFPAGDAGLEPAEAACAAAGWSCERSAQPTLALVRLIRPPAGRPPIGLLVVAAAAGGLGPAGLAKAARSHAACRELPLLVVGDAVGLDGLAACRSVPAGDAAGLAAAIAELALPSAAVPPPVDPGLLDPATLAMLRGLPGVWDQALATFARDLPGHLDAIDRAIGDPPALHRAAHALKGAAGSIGAAGLHRLLATIDQAAVQGDAARAAALLPGLRPLAERSLAALRGVRP